MRRQKRCPASKLFKNILQTTGDSLNVLGILTTGMPTVIGWQPPAAPIARAQYVVGDAFALSGVTLALLVGALLITSGYLGIDCAPCSSRTNRAHISRVFGCAPVST
jgi:hypothetical protein